MEKEQDVYLNYRNVYKKIIPMEMKHNLAIKKPQFYKENASSDDFLDMVTNPVNQNLPKNSSGQKYGSPVKLENGILFDSDILEDDTKAEIREIFTNRLFDKLSDKNNILIHDSTERHYVSEKWLCGCFFDGLSYSKISCEVFDKFSGDEGSKNKYSDDYHNKIIRNVWNKTKTNIIKKIKEDVELLQLLRLLGL